MHKLLQCVVQRAADGLLIAVILRGLLAAARVNNAAGQVPLMVGVHHLADIGDADAFQFVVAVVAVLVGGAFGRGVGFEFAIGVVVVGLYFTKRSEVGDYMGDIATSVIAILNTGLAVADVGPQVLTVLTQVIR